MANVGRPTKMTEEVVRILEQAFAMGCSDREACLMADISHQTLYDYQTLNPEFVDRKEMLKETPILKARQTIIDNLNSPNIATWYLERKKKDEFTPKQEIENTGTKELDAMRDNLNKLTKYVKTGTTPTNPAGNSDMQTPA
jgi:hypothetical protein